jgi:hypothetical protein
MSSFTEQMNQSKEDAMTLVAEYRPVELMRLVQNITQNIAELNTALRALNNKQSSYIKRPTATVDAEQAFKDHAQSEIYFFSEILEAVEARFKAEKLVAR